MQNRIEGFLWPDWVIDKISSKHGVEPGEAEEVFFNSPHRVQKRSTSKYLLYGQSNSGRYLFIVVTTHPSFLRKQESIRIAVNASLPDGFLLSQE